LSVHEEDQRGGHLGEHRLADGGVAQAVRLGRCGFATSLWSAHGQNVAGGFRRGAALEPAFHAERVEGELGAGRSQRLSDLPLTFAWIRYDFAQRRLEQDVS
jgi:hypothetical protein